MDDRHCRICAGTMEEGFVVDHAHNALIQEQWVGGTPKPSFWTGIKLSGVKRYKVTTFRCAECDYLESFATQAVD